MSAEHPFRPAPSCADDHDAEALAPEEALRRIVAEIEPARGNERLALRSALGRILADGIRSSVNVPGHTNAAMDGYAVMGSDLGAGDSVRLRVVGKALAGRPFQGRVGSGECVRIMTGAVIPEGADSVLMQEHVQAGESEILVRPGQKPGQNVREAGEDIAIGAPVLPPGRRLTPADLGLIASLGIGEVGVYRRARVAFFSTGDELRSIGEPLPPGAVYDSNRYTLYGMLSRLGAEPLDMGVVRDDEAALERAFRDAMSCADALITSGGASVGEADYITETLGRIGRVSFWKVAVKPGRPIAFGRLGDTCFFGLPGNPVSVMATFYELVQPALRRLMGERAIQPLALRARCLGPLKKKLGRVEYQRGVLSRADDGELLVTCTGPQGSALLTSMSAADCFIVLPADWGRVAAGTLVEVQPFYGLI
jgi:molybdopterin molybdotransferase